MIAVVASSAANWFGTDGLPRNCWLDPICQKTGCITGRFLYSIHKDTLQNNFCQRCAKTPTTGDIVLQTRCCSSCGPWSSLHRNAEFVDKSIQVYWHNIGHLNTKKQGKTTSSYLNKTALLLVTGRHRRPLDWLLAWTGCTATPEVRNCIWAERPPSARTPSTALQF